MPAAATPHSRVRAGLRHSHDGNGNAAEHAWSQGVAAVRQGQLARAASHFERATRLAPRIALYWLNLANTQRKLQQADAALASTRRAVALDGASEPACHLLAELLRMRHCDAEALQVLQALAPETPRSPRHSLMLGSLLMAQQQPQEAALAFLQVLAEKPADTEAYMQLGFALADLARYGEAAECFRTVTLVDPSQFGAAVYAAHYAAWACDWREGDADRQRLHAALALQDGAAKPGPAFSPFCLLSMDDDAALHRRGAEMEARRIAAQASAQRPLAWPAAQTALARGQLRIGFVSADFRTHATSMLLVRTLERLPRDRFHVTLYSHGRDDASPLRRRMAAAADAFVECGGMPAPEQARRIREDGTTILVDLSGYTASSRLGVFALRPAPLQVLWLAYPGTIGGDFIDYIVGDPILTPLAHEGDFSERIAQLPLCYEPTDELREHPPAVDRDACGLPDDGFVFACFNQSYKITEGVFSRWCRILQRVPGSVLWLLVPQPAIQAALRERAAERGIGAERIVFAPFVDPLLHLARLQRADLFLDTFPYGAHTTCSDALWMGLPVLTQTGRSFAARVAASLLNAAGLPQMAVADQAAYEERAVALATHDRAGLDAMRTHLCDRRLALPLFDNARFTGEVAALFDRMATRWQQGLAPETLAAEASA